MPTFDLSAEQRVQILFRDPSEPPQTPSMFGTLYLLRRDIRDLMIALPEAGYWPRTMAVLAGIDLVAKFYCNNDDAGRVGDRFKTFVRERIVQTHADPDADAAALYHLRNSLLHSFGLYSEGQGRTYRFTVTYKTGDILLRNDSANPECWLVDLGVLQESFEKAVSEYHDQLHAGTARYPLSENLFEKYGWVWIGNREVPSQ